MITKKIYSILVLLAFIIVLSSGCKKENVADSQNPGVELEELDFPGIMMTLSAISYASDSSTETIIRNHIIELLADKDLATEGNWKLAWGPGISPDSANLVYVVMADTEPISYALVVRGTNPHSVPGVVQDADVFKLVPFKGGEANDSISNGAMDGMNNILKTSDAHTNRSLEWFLDSVAADKKINLFVTGHSQGGYLAPVMAYWVMNNQKFIDKFTIRTLTFAGPTVGNYGFSKNFISTLNDQGGSIQMFVNDLDVIPYFWYNIPGLKENSIPVTVPEEIALGYSISEFELKQNKIKYYSLADPISIGTIAIDTTEKPLTTADSTAWYKKWTAVEHNHNNYLLLLGEKPMPF